jgi:hypothetical protein
MAASIEAICLRGTARSKSGQLLSFGQAIPKRVQDCHSAGRGASRAAGRSRPKRSAIQRHTT